MRSWLRWVVLLLSALLCTQAFAQRAEEPRPRKTVGLALEGGTALGLAHIGVLKWFERNHIPVDYVAGSSMGGVMAGAYATGMRADEIEALVRGIDWNLVMSGETEFKDLSFRRKEDRRAYPSTLEFGMKHGLGMPAGFNSGQQVDVILDRVALPYSNVVRFDDLPIPFRCVATDLTKRELHIFEDGRMQDALRATMSMPGIFAPVRLNGHIYVDGGMFDNLPVDVARSMGADQVLAIHLEIAGVKPDAELSPFSVLVQSYATIDVANERRSLKMADLPIVVDLTDIDTMDFSKRDEIIQRGFAAAEKNREALLKLALDDSAWQQHLARRDARRIKTMPAPQFVRVSGATPGIAEQISSDLMKLKGQTVETARIERELMKIAGSGRFSQVRYNFVEDGGRPGLQVLATEKEYASPVVTPNLSVDGSDFKNVRFAAGARLTFFDVGKPGAEMRAEAVLGSTYRFATEYYMPLLHSHHWFLSTHADAENRGLPIYSRGDRLAEFRRIESMGGADVGYQFNRFSELRAGYEVGWLKWANDVGDAKLLPAISGTQRAARARYTFDHLDDAVMPRKGMAFASNFGYFLARPGAANVFKALDGRFEAFQPISKPGSVFVTASGGTTFGFDRAGVPMFTLGGPMRLSAYGQNEMFTNQYFLFQAGYLHEIMTLPPLVGKKVYFTSLYEVGKAYNPGLTNLPMDGTAGVTVQTILGPVFVGGSWGDSGHRKFFFQVGKAF